MSRSQRGDPSVNRGGRTVVKNIHSITTVAPVRLVIGGPSSRLDRDLSGVTVDREVGRSVRGRLRPVVLVYVIDGKGLGQGR